MKPNRNRNALQLVTNNIFNAQVTHAVEREKCPMSNVPNERGFFSLKKKGRKGINARAGIFSGKFPGVGS